MRTTKKLYQWDTDQKLIDCVGKYVDYPIGDEVYRIEVIDKECIIPDELLQASGTVKVYECMEYGTVKAYAFYINPRPKPPDYVFTPTERLTFEGLVKKVDETIEDLQKRADSGEFNGSDYVITESDYDAIAAKSADKLQPTIGELARTLETEKTDREQADKDMQKDISDLVGVEGNLIDKSSVVDDSYINAEGNVAKASGFFCTDYIPVLENKSYYWSSLYKGYYAFYDSDKKFIDGAKGSNNLTNPFTTPIGTAYARFTALNQEAMANAWIYEENRRPSDYKKVVKMPLKSESIGEYNLIDSSVTEAKIADKCIGAEKIKNYSVEPKVTTFIVHDDETDFIDGWEKDKYVNAQGQLTNYEGFYATEPIYLSENTTYYWDRFRNGYYAFYDAEGNVIESHGDDRSLAKPFVTPTGTVFARFTAIREDQTRYSWISTQNKKPDKYGYMLDKSIKVKSEEFDNSYCNYNGNEVCMFTKGLCIGDSLTEGTFNYYLDGSIAHYKNISKYSYPSIFQRLTGIPMTNKGHGGMTSIQWYEAEKDNTFSGYDFAIIQLGVNDAIQIGSWTQEVETAFRNIITKLKSENKGIKIFVSTITPAIDYSGEQFDRITTGIRSFVPSLNDDNVILLDMAIYSSLGDTKAYNCGHYTAYGYWRLAQDYKNYIGYVMNTNKLAFRNVQFINTDYEVNP